MVEVEDVLIFDEVGAFQDRFKLGPFFVTFRSVIAMLIGALFGYGFIQTFRLPDVLFGSFIIAFVVFITVYPKRSVNIENLLISAAYYYTEKLSNTIIQHRLLKEFEKEGFKLSKTTKRFLGKS